MGSDEFQLIGSHNNVSQLMVVSLNQAAPLPDSVARDVRRAMFAPYWYYNMVGATRSGQSLDTEELPVSNLMCFFVT